MILNVTKLLLFSLFFTILITGCIKKPERPLYVSNLTEMLMSLSPSVDIKESKLLSKGVIQHSVKLSDSYNITTSSLYHNFLVNIGIKKRGLCWHFAYDMLSYVKKQNFKSFKYFIGGANIGSYWSEHNTLIVTCAKCSFDEGIVLDPWRDPRNLYFSKINSDKKYKWKQRGGVR